MGRHPLFAAEFVHHPDDLFRMEGLLHVAAAAEGARSWMSYVKELSSYNVDRPCGVMHP